MWEAQFLVLLLLQLPWVAPGKTGLTLWEGCPPDPWVGEGVVSRDVWTSQMPSSLAWVDSSNALLGAVFLPPKPLVSLPVGWGRDRNPRSSSAPFLLQVTEAPSLLLSLLAHGPSPWPLFSSPVEAPGSGTEVRVVWAQEGAPVQLPCSPTAPLQDVSLLRTAGVTWHHLPDSGPPAPAPSLRPAAPSARGPGPRRYVVLMLAAGGLRSGRPPLQPRVQLDERGLQRGDFSLWLRPARRADAGEYRAAVHLRDRSLACRLRLRVGQASMTASPPGSLRISDWVILNCSFSRPDLPASVHWFRGRVPVHESPHHHIAGSFLFLPQVSPSDSGPWGCILTYRDGFNVSLTYNLTVLGLEPSVPLMVYAGAGSRVDLPCRLPPGVGTQSSLTAKWTPPGGGPDLLVAGDHGNFTLQLEAVSQAQAGVYTCHIHLQGEQLSATVTLAVITGAQSSGRAPGALKTGHLPLFSILGILFLLLLMTGAFGFHLWRRQWHPRRFSALEHGTHPPQAQSKIAEPEPELEPEPESEPEPEKL
ncbi:lymphocyte activation gene 3 protein isoform X1 [Mirounga leonina]|uniref:lymphocyte activation gene 3 protein isoform X1 n=1 Tax=Mirounga leonina TaxID=9715 RepID=UPI00156BE53F|nr:lymphocyte activation gene 3 protein isoform X1 [Mirounga leonina]